MDDVLTLDRPAVFLAGKDRPILFGALAWADVLLTLDQNDFGALMDKHFTACWCSGQESSWSGNAALDGFCSTRASKKSFH